MENQEVLVLLERYDWVKGHWVQFRKRLLFDLEDEGIYHDTCPVEIISCVFWEFDSVALFYYEFEQQISVMTNHIARECKLFFGRK